jgi:predicted outer membrane repeat protein
MSVITVRNTADRGEGSLRAAIEAAQAGDTIKFSSRLANRTITLTTGQLLVNKDITIDGVGAANLTISGNGQSRVFLASQAGSGGAQGVNFTLRNLTIADGLIANDRGGAIDIRDGGSLMVDNVKFFNNISTAGAVSARKNTTVTITDSIFDGNDASRFANLTVGSPTAGAVNVLTESTLTIRNSQFTNNLGTYGGAVGSVFSTTIIEDSSFVNNRSLGFGGAIYVDGGSWPTEEEFLPPGVLPKPGPGGAVLIRNSLIQGNQATGEGGGIGIWGYDHDFVTIENSTIIDNQVTRSRTGLASGGGLRLSGYVTVLNSTIANNRSADEGGGLWYQGTVPVKILDTNFSGNLAGSRGGAIYNSQWDSFSEIVGSQFTNNTAVLESGAIHSERQRVITVQNSDFIGNGVGNGGRNPISNFAVFHGLTAQFLNAPGRLVGQGDGNANTLSGGQQADIVFGMGGNDALMGDGGADTLKGGADNDSLTGGDGNDRLFGGVGNDWLLGGVGNDWLGGDLGDDTLMGGDGNDRLFGGSGNDVLFGSGGRDTLVGWGGRDRFTLGDSTGIFAHAFSTDDSTIIQDFRPEEDEVQLPGSAGQYTLASLTRNNLSGTGLFTRSGHLVALFQDIQPTQVSLNSTSFRYV